MSLYQRTKAKGITADKEKINKIVSETMEQMSNIVGATLGSGGRPVLIERDGLSPMITKDGVTVAKSLGVENAEANIIIEAAKEICIKTANEAGDGTTTAIVLASALVKYGQEFIKANPKYNPQRIVNELQDAYEQIIVPYLSKNAIKVKNEKQLINVAQISANGDKKIAEAVVEAVVASGDDGHVLIEEGQGNIMRVETIDGYIITMGLKDIGQMGPVFINDKANQQVTMDKGLVFLYDGSISDLKVPGYIQDMIESQGLFGQPLIIMAHEFSDLVIDRFVKNVKGGITIVPIKTPRSGLPNGRSMFLQDMSAYTNAKIYDPTNIDSIGNDTEVFGSFDNAKVNMYESFISCTVDSEKIENRTTELKSIMNVAMGEIDRGLLRAAISKLTGGVSTIWVGGTSELEVREKKARVEDAVEAVRSAIAEGVVPGGASISLVLAEKLSKMNKKKDSWVILEKALREPFKLLLSNCGEDPEEVYESLKKGIVNTRGLPKKIFDTRDHCIANPFKAGVIEPAKVTRVSIGNALSVASLLITLGGLVVVPRNSGLEAQIDMANSAVKAMMNDEAVGQQ